MIDKLSIGPHMLKVPRGRSWAVAKAWNCRSALLSSTVHANDYATTLSCLAAQHGHPRNSYSGRAMQSNPSATRMPVGLSIPATMCLPAPTLNVQINQSPNCTPLWPPSNKLRQVISSDHTEHKPSTTIRHDRKVLLPARSLALEEAL